MERNDQTKRVSNVRTLEINGTADVKIDADGTVVFRGTHMVTGDGVLQINSASSSGGGITISGSGISVSGNTVDRSSSISITTKGGSGGSIFINGKRYTAPGRSVEMRGNTVIVDGKDVSPSDTKEQRTTTLVLTSDVQLSEIKLNGSSSCAISNVQVLSRELTIMTNGASIMTLPRTGFDKLYMVAHGASKIKCGGSTCIDMRAVLRGASKITGVDVAIEGNVEASGASSISLRKMNEDTVIRETASGSAKIKTILI